MSSSSQVKPKEQVSETAEPVVRSKHPGHVPHAVVVARHGLETVTRPGRGFSHGELSGAGLTVGQVATSSLSIDIRRRSVLDANVSALKGWAASHPYQKKAKGKGKKIEKEIKKVAKEVEKGAEDAEKAVEKVEREAEKVAKKAKQEAAKVEKGAKKPKPKAKAKAKPKKAD